MMGETSQADKLPLSYLILYKGGSAELTEKKSRFIATTYPVESEEEALAFVEEMRKKYWDARHNCWAYVIGERGEKKRCSDDGEPSQTAGKPMLDVLTGSGVTNLCVVVTRYFGGVLLGTGGLVRAYSGAAKEGLKKSVIVEKKLAKKIQVDTDYNGLGKIQYIAAERDIAALDTQYSDKVVITFLVPLEEVPSFEAALTEGTNGKAEIETLSVLYYGNLEKKILLFEEIP
ncbi:MAG: YigZ family protein [Lachnospiraceae bacterium]